MFKLMGKKYLKFYAEKNSLSKPVYLFLLASKCYLLLICSLFSDYRTTQNPDLDLTTKIHNASVYTKSLCHITDIMSGPVLQSLESRLERNKNRIESLKREKEELLKQLENT